MKFLLALAAFVAAEQPKRCYTSPTQYSRCTFVHGQTNPVCCNSDCIALKLDSQGDTEYKCYEARNDKNQAKCWGGNNRQADQLFGAKSANGCGGGSCHEKRGQCKLNSCTGRQVTCLRDANGNNISCACPGDRNKSTLASKLNQCVVNANMECVKAKSHAFACFNPGSKSRKAGNCDPKKYVRNRLRKNNKKMNAGNNVRASFALDYNQNPGMCCVQSYNMDMDDIQFKPFKASQYKLDPVNECLMGYTQNGSVCTLDAKTDNPVGTNSNEHELTQGQ